MRPWGISARATNRRNRWTRAGNNLFGSPAFVLEQLRMRHNTNLREATPTLAFVGPVMLLKYLPKPGSKHAAAADRLCSVWPTSATPASFAPPIDLDEDESAYTLCFHIGESTPNSIEVVFAGPAMFIRSKNITHSRQATRVFLLRSGIDTLGSSTRIEPPMLIVRIPKSAGGRRTIVVRHRE